MDGACESCRRKSLTLQRQSARPAPSVVPAMIVHDVLRSPGEPLDAATRSAMSNRFANSPGSSVASITRTPLQATLAVNQPGDRYEQEADAVSERVMQAPESRDFPGGRAFAGVRLHTDFRAAESARALGALAYTVGQDIIFASGQYAPHTSRGQHLLAHELTHTLQQTDAASRMIMGVWDATAKSKCADATSDKWIKKVEVNQEPSDNETVTVHWSDDSTESGQCSTGKGHCCVDASNSSAVACTAEGSKKEGSNCTPITQNLGYLVKDRVFDHSGVFFWTEFVPSPRSIALHKYAPVDGTPLSHGCVRLNEDMAKKIFCNVRETQTGVQVHGFARPKCDTANLQAEWKGDFSMGGRDLSKADGDLKAEIQETRRELNAAFGRKLTVDEIQKLTEKDIPRCTNTAPLPKPPSP